MRLTQELAALAVRVANDFGAIDTPLLVGSTVWLGEGADIDVVILVDDYNENQPWRATCSEYPSPEWRTARVGDVNIIGTTSQREWASWKHAARRMEGVPPERIRVKRNRVYLCETYREEGRRKYDEATRK
jgi:hypothetical protein